ncbi:hypothetical protein Tco_0586441 [Tanacetum coccineum]
MTQQFKALKEQVKENKQKLDKLIAFRVPYAIEESVTTHVIYEIKNQVPTLVPDVVANFIQLHSIECDCNLALYNALWEKNQKKHKLDGESYASKEQVTFELANYEAQPSSTDKSRRHEEWFTKDAYTYYYWVDKETNVHGWFNKLMDASKDPKDDEIILDDSTVAFAKRLKRSLNVNKLTKEDLKRRKKDGFERFGNSFMRKTEDQELVADYSKLAPLVGPRFNQRVPIEHFFNDDLEYLMHRNKERMYALSLTKCPTAEYTISWIEEAISRLFRSSVADYDDDAELGIHHWPDLQKGFYKMRRASLTKYGVHSNYMIVTVKHVKVECQFDYGFLSSVKSDGKEYTFKESDYYRLNLNDIKDMYVLKAQGKLHHLRGQAEYDLANSLRIYIRKEVIKKRVDDV